jgi:transcriptional regulator with XRE-family HTH domain
MSDLKKHLQEKMKNPAFARAWEETELEYQISRAVIKLRLDMGLTQKQLAQKAEVPQSVIARLESGRHLPSLRSLKQIAKKLELHIVLDFKPQKKSAIV